MVSRGSESRKQLIFNGLTINAGTVMAPICLYSAERHRNIIRSQLSSDREVTEEVAHLRSGLAACSTELDRITADVSKSIGVSESEIFVTQKHIMNDSAIIDRIETMIVQDRSSAEYSVNTVLGDYEEQFRKIGNLYMRERANDIGEVRTRLLDYLRDTRPGFVCEGQHQCSKGKNRIIAAEILTPDMIVQMDLQSVLGFITEHGGINSHAAVIARSLGIPAISGLEGLLDHIRCGDKVLIDGDTGTVYVNPPAETVASVGIKTGKDEPADIIVTPEGMQVMANASFMEDVRTARSVNADGIGLFRTEMLFLKENRLLNEDEQYALYRRIVETMDGRPVIFRLLDVGGDKPLPFLRIEQEANPYLGWRGARFLLGSPEIMSSQVRALARASVHGKLKLMVPMVVDAAQTSKLMSIIKETILDTGVERSSIEIGAMFEVPSAILDARAILQQIDFGSIGSNDLIQYTFAIDRNNERVSHDYNPDHPVLWDMLSRLSSEASQLRKPLSICGEMAARDGVPTKLVQAGILSLSVSPRLISRVRCELNKCAAVTA